MDLKWILQWIFFFLFFSFLLDGGEKELLLALILR